ncbi:MAG: LTA synthase family protein [Lachnospiraceae bacterium]
MLISSFWILIGIVNGVILIYRKTPFTAVDITLVKSTLPVINHYLEIWQIIAILILLVLIIIGLVCLFLYGPVEKNKNTKRNIILFLVVIACLVGVTNYGYKTEKIDKRFSNLQLAYRDFGVPYCFTVTMLENGISQPSRYSKKEMKSIKKEVSKRIEKTSKKEAKKDTNVIIVQLESFFDLTAVKNISLSEDPIPNFRKYMKEYSSGYLKMPVYGAGTINSEFEVLTGLNINYFGPGEYPYKTILQKKACETIATNLKENGYKTHVIHNNNASFYDRDKTFPNLGIDEFTPIELIDVKKTSSLGWAKDEVLTGEIIDILKSSKEKDFIYAISVEGHGDYTTAPIENPQITVSGCEDEKKQNQFTDYANKIYEMDKFIKQLIEAVKEYGEDTVIVFFGDHLPSLEISNKDLTYESKFWTNYFIWDNIGLKREEKTMEAYQLSSYVLEKLNITTGFLNQFHQTMKDEEDYRKKLKLVEYDLLYGHNYINKGKNLYEATKMEFGVKDITLDRIQFWRDTVVIKGDNFTQYSKVTVNGARQKTKFIDSHTLEIESSAFLKKDGTVIRVDQVNKTREYESLRSSKEYIFYNSLPAKIMLKQEKEEN